MLAQFSIEPELSPAERLGTSKPGLVDRIVAWPPDVRKGAPFPREFLQLLEAMLGVAPSYQSDMPESRGLPHAGGRVHENHQRSRVCVSCPAPKVRDAKAWATGPSTIRSGLRALKAPLDRTAGRGSAH